MELYEELELAAVLARCLELLEADETSSRALDQALTEYPDVAPLLEVAALLRSHANAWKAASAKVAVQAPRWFASPHRDYASLASWARQRRQTVLSA